jgi:peptidyl-prolyl cis-trans isomerase C
MARLHSVTFATALALGAITGCSQQSADDVAADLGSARVAVVNGQPLAESLLRIYVLTAERRNLEDLNAEERERVVNDLIGLQLLAQKADESGLTSSRTLAAQIELQRLRMVANAMANDYLEKNPPSEAELEAIYNENLAQLSGEQYKARHILVPTKEEADGVIARLRGGEDFVALAQAHADGPTGPNGGALDWLTLDSMPPPFAAALQTLTVGSYTAEPVRTDYGFHVILLEETRKQEPPALADIRNDVSSAAQRKKLDDYISSLREAATVTVEP